jgi:hypothetical protein
LPPRASPHALAFGRHPAFPSSARSSLSPQVLLISNPPNTPPLDALQPFCVTYYDRLDGRKAHLPWLRSPALSIEKPSSLVPTSVVRDRSMSEPLWSAAAHSPASPCHICDPNEGALPLPSPCPVQPFLNFIVEAVGQICFNAAVCTPSHRTCEPELCAV